MSSPVINRIEETKIITKICQSILIQEDAAKQSLLRTENTG